MEFLVNLHQKYVHDLADPRSADLWLVDLWCPLGIIIFYIYFCWNAKSLTSRLPAISMRPLIVAYNLMMTIISAYIFLECVTVALNAVTDIWCWQVDWGNSPWAIRTFNVFCLYYMSKYIELVEALMFALRKKYSQISFLHVYHHVSMIMLCWLVTKYSGGGQAVLFVAFNSFVHWAMYTYYGLSALGPYMQKYLWWKKYITTLQLSQFMTMCIHTSISQAKGCSYSPAVTIFASLICFALFFSFGKFYVKNYLGNSKQKPVVKND